MTGVQTCALPIYLIKLIEACGVVGAAAGSLFVFKGAYRAVLINYPNPVAKQALFSSFRAPS